MTHRRKKKRGRPFVSAAEHQRRGTVRPCRTQKTATKKTSGSRSDPPVSRDYLAILDAYLAGVSSGSIVACRWTKLAVERFQRMRCHMDPYGNDAWSPDHVVAVCRFVEQLPHVEGKWRSETIQLEPFQVFILAAV